MQFIPLDQIGAGSSPVGSGLIPSFSRTQQIIDGIRGNRGPGSVSPTAQAKAIEDTMGVALGAALAGAAEANGWGESATAMVGAAAAVYGVMNGHPMLANIGRGLFAPYIARLAAQTFAPKHAPPAAAPA